MTPPPPSQKWRVMSSERRMNAVQFRAKLVHQPKKFFWQRGVLLLLVTIVGQKLSLETKDEGMPFRDVNFFHDIRPHTAILTKDKLEEMS